MFKPILFYLQNRLDILFYFLRVNEEQQQKGALLETNLSTTIFELF